MWNERIYIEDKRDSDNRNEYDRDYARIIHSSAFRRLQTKTQVLGLGESDFYRTRLTHSMEVFQIGAGIVKSLEHEKRIDSDISWDEIQPILPEQNLMGAICLAHDLGHPPFGHGGETALNECMKSSGGFEGNAHTLRILSKLEQYTEKNGINPSRRTYLGLLKYPTAYTDAVNDAIYQQGNYTPPKCYFDSSKELIDWVLSPLTDEEKSLFTHTVKRANGHAKTIYKSFDTSVMEIADDISYGVHDLEDSISLQLITKDMWQEYFYNEKKALFTDCGLDYENITKEIFSESFKQKKTIGTLANKMIVNTKIKTVEGFTTPLVKYNVYLEQNHELLLKCFKDMVFQYVIKSTEVKRLEYKGKRLIMNLFKVFKENPKDLLSAKRAALYEIEGERVICDYIAGMTDEYASKMYEKLFLPHKGSIFDRI